jgi:hypothetical protein
VAVVHAEQEAEKAAAAAGQHFDAVKHSGDGGSAVRKQDSVGQDTRHSVLLASGMVHDLARRLSDLEASKMEAINQAKVTSKVEGIIEEIVMRLGACHALPRVTSAIICQE